MRQCVTVRRLRELSSAFTDSQLLHALLCGQERAARRTSGAERPRASRLHTKEPLAAATGNAIDCTDTSLVQSEQGGVRTT